MASPSHGHGVWVKKGVELRPTHSHLRPLGSEARRYHLSRLKSASPVSLPDKSRMVMCGYCWLLLDPERTRRPQVHVSLGRRRRPARRRMRRRVRLSRGEPVRPDRIEVDLDAGAEICL